MSCTAMVRWRSALHRFSEMISSYNIAFQIAMKPGICVAKAEMLHFFRLVSYYLPLLT